MKIQKIVCIDFDGVIHSYSSGWKGANIISDSPVKGAIQWLINLLENDDLKPVIYSARSCQVGGIDAMKDWLLQYGLPPKYICFNKLDAETKDGKLLGFPVTKPPAFLTIDDRAIVFEGVFPSTTEIIKFKSWLGN